MGSPAVSCLLPSNRSLALLERSVACYCAQSYANRELVLVSDGPAEHRAALASLVRRLDRDDVRFVSLDEPCRSLAELRNVTLDHAAGDILCQWDEDDLYHPLRIERQVASLQQSGVVANCLSEHLHYFAVDHEAYWIDWNNVAPRFGLSYRVLPGSLVCWASEAGRYATTGPRVDLGEDSAFLEDLIARGPVEAVSGEPHLYVYSYHGGNAYPLSHHRLIVERRGCSEAHLAPRRTELERELARFDWPQGPPRLRGNDHLAGQAPA